MEPPHLLLDGKKDPMHRALFVISLGCEAFPGGVDDFSPSKLHKQLATLFVDQFTATTPSSTQTDAKKMKVGELNALLKKHRLPTNGLKKDLQPRWQNHLESCKSFEEEKNNDVNCREGNALQPHDGGGE